MPNKKFTKENIKKSVIQNANWFYGLLKFSFFVSLIAIPFDVFGFLEALYFVDLFSHFTIQYAIGAFVFFFLFLIFKDRKKAVISFVIFLICLIETRWYLQQPMEFLPVDATPVYRVMSYNQLIFKSDFDNVGEFLKTENFDAVIFQEASAHTVKFVKNLEEKFPYQIYEPRSDPFGLIVLSKHPFLKTEKIVLDGHSYESLALNFRIKSEKATQPLSIYTLHPPPPSGPIRSLQRSYELMRVASEIKYINDQNIIMIGDFNLTPFSPTFGRVLKASDLNYQSYGLLLNPSWPSFNVFSFLKIPIDHAFYSDNLIQVEKTIAPSFGSDHHALIVSYAEKE